MNKIMIKAVVIFTFLFISVLAQDESSGPNIIPETCQSDYSQQLESLLKVSETSLKEALEVKLDIEGKFDVIKSSAAASDAKIVELTSLITTLTKEKEEFDVIKSSAAASDAKIVELTSLTTTLTKEKEEFESIKSSAAASQAKIVELSSKEISLKVENDLLTKQLQETAAVKKELEELQESVIFFCPFYISNLHFFKLFFLNLHMKVYLKQLESLIAAKGEHPLQTTHIL